MKTTLSARTSRYLSIFGVLLMTTALVAGMAGCEYTPPTSKDLEIRTWYDLDDVRDNLAGHHRLMNNLDSTSDGYTSLASEAAHGGKGWKPLIEFYYDYPISFAGTVDGQGYEIRDLFINRPGEDYVGLFGSVGGGGVIQNIGVVNATVIGAEYVGGLVGTNYGTVISSYSSGSVTGDEYIGGLAGMNAGRGTVSNSYSTSSVTGDKHVGGLVGENLNQVEWVGEATVINSYSTGSVTGNRWVGGLVGKNYYGAVSNSYSTGSVTGDELVGGLVGINHEGPVINSYFTGSVSGTTGVGGVVGDYCYGNTVSNCHYNHDEVLINGENIITRGALFDEDFEQWLANDMFLDVNERLSQENGYYVVNNVTDFKELLAFGENATLKFRLKSDLNLATEPNFHIPCLAGEFDGNGHKISNLSFNFAFVYSVGLFGCLAPGGNVTNLAAENVNITGDESVGGLVGFNEGTVGNSSSTGSVTGQGFVGGLVGDNWYLSTVSDSYFTGTVTGDCNVGGLVGRNIGSVSDSYSNGDVDGTSSSVGGLVGHNGGTVRDSHSTGTVTSDNNVGGLVGENGGTVSNCYSSNTVASHAGVVGGLMGANYGDVSDCYSTGAVTGSSDAGGLVGFNGEEGTLSNCHASGSVTGGSNVGGLIGENANGFVGNSYSTGSVTGSSDVGGLVGFSDGQYNVTNSFWDTQTSGQATSDGGTGKTTAQMKNIATFSGAGWNIIAVGGSGERNPIYIWNIVDDITYPFLSWQS
jgi:hypothetical protein